MNNYPVLIVDYDPQWPSQFEQEQERILGALSGLGFKIEHIGSTSVPGLAAKPIIDMLAIAPDAAAGEKTIAPLSGTGYQYLGEYGIPGRFYFTKTAPLTYHLHMFPCDHPDVERHLLFRDFLRAHPDTARQFAELKRALADKYRDDRDAYTEAKTCFIRATEAEALIEKTKGQVPHLPFG